MGQESSVHEITTALNIDGPSRPVESKSKWPGGQIRWPWVNGPVLTTLLIAHMNLTVHSLEFTSSLNKLEFNFPG